MDVKSRKRGVKASRTKLDAAMLNVGIKTQSSLAEHIAVNEKLETAPKDTINRAFRQESVSPTTIARIAKILKVEAYTLYLSQKEDDLHQQNRIFISDKQKQPADKQAILSRRFYKVAFGATLTIFIVLFSVFGIKERLIAEKMDLNVTGHWIFESAIEGGVTGTGELNNKIEKYELAIQLIQDGNTLKGMYLGATNGMCGKARLSGTVIGNQIEWLVTYIGCSGIRKTFKGEIIRYQEDIRIKGNTTPINTPTRKSAWSGYETFVGVQSKIREP